MWTKQLRIIIGFKHLHMNMIKNTKFPVQTVKR